MSVTSETIYNHLGASLSNQLFCNNGLALVLFIKSILLPPLVSNASAGSQFKSLTNARLESC